MAVYVNNSRYVQDPTKAGGAGDGVVMEYMVDTPADIAKLPDNTKIKETSTAYIISTGQVKVLTETGWDKDL